MNSTSTVYSSFLNTQGCSHEYPPVDTLLWDKVHHCRGGARLKNKSSLGQRTLQVWALAVLDYAISAPPLPSIAEFHKNT